MNFNQKIKTWIGLSNFNQLDNSLQWVTSESSYQNRRSFKNWFGKAPEKQPSEVTCAYLGKVEKLQITVLYPLFCKFRNWKL